MTERAQSDENPPAQLAELRAELAALQTQAAALQAQHDLLENLITVARTAPDAATLELTLQKMLDVSIELTAATNGSLFLLDAAGAVTNSILTRGQASPEQRRAIIGSVMERGLAGWVARERQVGLIADTQTDTRWFTLPYEPYAFRSALALPLLRGEQVLGVLSLMHSMPGHFTTQHAQLMRATAEQMVLVLDNAWLHAATRQELAERRRAELALQASNHELAEAKARLEQVMQSRLAESEAAVHDLRHGLHDLISTLDIFKIDLLDAQVAPALIQPGIKTINSAIEGMSSLLDDLLDAARLRNNALTLTLAPTDMAALVEQVARRLEGMCRMFGCTLTVGAVGPLPAAWCDARRMARVIYNLLHNALKYSTVRDDGAPGAVQVMLAQEQGQIVCRIADNGPGIAPDQLARLGQRFARAASGAELEGTGLGLSFSVGITRLHGGSLAITSAGLGQGATVIVCLPCAADRQPQTQ